MGATSKEFLMEAMSDLAFGKTWFEPARDCAPEALIR